MLRELLTAMVLVIIISLLSIALYLTCGVN